jgi:hypothetical protein
MPRAAKANSKSIFVHCPHCGQRITAAAAANHMAALDMDEMLEHAHCVARPAYPGPAGRRPARRRGHRSVLPVIGTAHGDIPMDEPPSAAGPSHPPPLPSRSAEDAQMPGAQPPTEENGARLSTDAADIDWAAVEDALANAVRLHEMQQDVDIEPLDLVSAADAEEEMEDLEDLDSGDEREAEDELEAAFWDDVFKA